MTPAVDHPAAAHDAVAPVGGIRAAIVPTVVGGTEADRKTRREAPAEPAPAPTVSGRAAVAAPTAMTAEAAMAILRSDVRVAVPPHQQQPERSMAGDETRSIGTGDPAGGADAGRRRAARVPHCRPAPMGHPRGCAFEASVRGFWQRNTAPGINRCDPPHSITVRPPCIIRPEYG